MAIPKITSELDLTLLTNTTLYGYKNNKQQGSYTDTNNNNNNNNKTLNMTIRWIASPCIGRR